MQKFALDRFNNIDKENKKLQDELDTISDTTDKKIDKLTKTIEMQKLDLQKLNKKEIEDRN